MQGELKFIINLDFLVPVLIFLEMLVNFYLSVAEQVTFVSQNCSVTCQDEGSWKDWCIFVNVMKEKKTRSCGFCFFVVFLHPEVDFFVFLNIPHFAFFFVLPDSALIKDILCLRNLFRVFSEALGPVLVLKMRSA